MGRKLVLLIIFILFSTASFGEDFTKYRKVNKYDRYFSKYSKRGFGLFFDWKYFKSQAIVESRLNPEAQSRTGALGVMQIMPKTWGYIVDKNPAIKGRANNPKWSIAAGIWYDRYLWNYYPEHDPSNRMKFMFGAYNMGSGNIKKSKKVAVEDGKDPKQWESMKEAIPKVRSWGESVLEYVEKIYFIREKI